jgi:hypothetical protein
VVPRFYTDGEESRDWIVVAAGELQEQVSLTEYIGFDLCCQEI